MSNRYSAIIEAIFVQKYQDGDLTVHFTRSDIEEAAKSLQIELPKNLGDLIYSFKYRSPLPDRIKKTAPDKKVWVIVGKGIAKYAFELKSAATIIPDDMLETIKIPDATPGIVASYALGDEQALLAKLRYNRLIDIFSGITCYSIQNHLRTTVQGIGQVETDELYVGIDKKGAHYVFPVQAKGGKDEIGIVQIEQDFALCHQKFPTLVCRPIAAQFMQESAIALFEFDLDNEKNIIKTSEKHYKLIPPEELSEEEISIYRNRRDP